MKKIILLLLIISQFSSAQNSFTEINSSTYVPNNSNPNQAPAATLASLTTYPDLATFQAALAGGPSTTENFGTNLIGANAVSGCGEIIDNATANACFAAGAVQPGFTIIANDDNADLAKDTVLLTTGFIGAPIDLVGANSFTDSTEIQFSTTAINAVAFDASSGTGAADVTITAFDSTNTIIGSFVLSIAALPATEFAGFTSSVPISKITVVGVAGAGELLGNLTYGSLAPPAPVPGLSLFSILLLLSILIISTFTLFKRKV